MSFGYKLTWVVPALLAAGAVAHETARAQSDHRLPSGQWRREMARANPVANLPFEAGSSLRRLPPVAPEPPQLTPPGRAIGRGPDGTWHEEGRFVVINLNGQEYRLVRSEAPPAAAPPVPQTGGAVSGRLSHNGRPLANCEVALMPLEKSWNGFTVANAADSQPPTTITDGSGLYYFNNVPAGLYKLKWRPAGQGSWIRRAEIRPDVRVRLNEITEVKEIRVALRTIN